MKKMRIYESAMCCPTGLCGVGIDKELLRISTIINNLEKNGVRVERFNLTSSPQEFIKNQEINDLMIKKGVEILPVTTVDNRIVKTGSYPTNEEIIKLLDIPPGVIEDVKAAKEEDSISKNISKCPNSGCC